MLINSRWGQKGVQGVLSVGFNCVRRDWPLVRCTAVSAAIRADAAPVAVDRLPPPVRRGVVSLRITVTSVVNEPLQTRLTARVSGVFCHCMITAAASSNLGPKGGWGWGGGLTNQAHPLTLLQP